MGTDGEAFDRVRDQRLKDDATMESFGRIMTPRSLQVGSQPKQPMDVGEQLVIDLEKARVGYTALSQSVEIELSAAPETSVD